MGQDIGQLQEVAGPIGNTAAPSGDSDLDWAGEIHRDCDAAFNTADYRAKLLKDYIKQEFHEVLYQDLPFIVIGGTVGGAGIGYGIGDEAMGPLAGSLGAGPGAVVGGILSFNLAVQYQLTKMPVQTVYYEAFLMEGDVRRQIELCRAERTRRMWEGIGK